MVIIYKTLKGYPYVYNILKRLLYIDNYYYIYYNIILIYYITIIILFIIIYIDILLFLYIIIYNILYNLFNTYVIDKLLCICYIMYVTYKSYSKGEYI